MTETYITLETAKLAKEKGFNEITKYLFENTPEGEMQSTNGGNDFWNDHEERDWYAQPAQHLLQRWLREKHNLHIYLQANVNGSYSVWIQHLDKPKVISGNFDVFEQTLVNGKSIEGGYEKALEAGLIEGLKLL